VPTSPIEDVLNLAVFAPLGVALAVKDALPGWISRGREQYETAKAVGELVTNYGQKKVARTLVGLGLLPGPPPPAPGPGSPPPAGAAPPAGATPATSPERAAPAPRATATTTPSANGHVAAMTEASRAADPDDLAIPGYDSLSASQVVSRLPGLAPGELEAVRVYELASRGRRTILTKISQLQTGWS
jgi:hypothetical protein